MLEGLKLEDLVITCPACNGTRIDPNRPNPPAHIQPRECLKCVAKGKVLTDAGRVFRAFVNSPDFRELL